MITPIGYKRAGAGELIAAVTPFLAAGERVVSVGTAVVDEHPGRTALKSSAKMGFMFVAVARPQPYVLTTSRLLLMNTGFRTHAEIVWAASRPFSVVRQPRNRWSRLVVLRTVTTGQTVPLQITRRGELRGLLSALADCGCGGQEALEPAHSIAVARTPRRTTPRRSGFRPWEADLATVAENRQGRVTAQQRARLRREGLGRAWLGLAAGLVCAAVTVLAYLLGWVTPGLGVFAALGIASAPIIAFQTLVATRPGAGCGSVSGPVRIQLTRDRSGPMGAAYRVYVGQRRLTHAGDITGLVEGAGYDAWFVEATGRILSMVRSAGTVSPAGASAATSSAEQAALGIPLTIWPPMPLG